MEASREKVGREADLVFLALVQAVSIWAVVLGVGVPRVMFLDRQGKAGSFRALAAG
jgi:hypothetical protein